MQVKNFIYTSNEALDNELAFVKDSPNVLVQIFCDFRSEENANELIQYISAILPNAEILLASSFANTADGEIYTETTAISVAKFQQTNITTLGFYKSDIETIMTNINDIITPDTKLLILFGATMEFDTHPIIEELTRTNPHITIVGGNAAENLSFQKTFVGMKDGTKDLVLVCGVLDSQVLKVYNDYIFEWSGVGVEMTITKAHNQVIKTINNIPASEVYRKYLGDKVADSMPAAAIEFPLLFQQDGVLIGRDIVKVLDDGSLVCGGHIPQGTKVVFGIGSLDKTKAKIKSNLQSLKENQIDAIFMYSCIGRYTFFKDTLLDYEIKAFNNLAPTGGFFTYGEYYHRNAKNYILNGANTYVALSEGIDEPKMHNVHQVNENPEKSNLIIHGLR